MTRLTNLQTKPLRCQKNPSDAPKNLRNLCKSVDKNPSSAIPCVRGEMIDSDSDPDSDPDPDPDLDETMKPETMKPRNLETQGRSWRRGG